MRDKSKEILSDIVVHMKYARYLDKEQRREIWEESVERNKQMHLKKFPQLENEINEIYEYVKDKKVLPSMRSMQFAGKPVDLNPARLYNCSYMAIDSPEVFNEAMFLLLSGCGVGFSVQKHHVEKLPDIKRPLKPKDNRHRRKRYLVGDSIEGWSDAIKVLMKSYFDGSKEIEFDYRDIRSKGEKLVTSGGKAPGPQPLKDCIHNIRKVLDTSLDDRGEHVKLKPIECHDILCHIADAVLVGGIRRAALISLFSLNDDEMLGCKFGNWWENNPQRGRANNSVVLLRHKLKKEHFFVLWNKIKASRSGEPAFLLTNDKEYGTNPCGEVSLKSNMFCNLTSINMTNIESQDDFENRCRIASWLGTIQASYTNFHYLRDIWRDNTEKEALLGVSMTGLADKNILENIDFKKGASIVKKSNMQFAKEIGINNSYRTCLVKPEGSSSLVCGSSSGIHAWHSPYYIRRIRVGKNEAIYHYLSINNPEILEEDFFNPDKQAIISLPVQAPPGAIYRDEPSIDLLERVKKINEDWVFEGHNKGSNKHNVSCTVSVKDHEWDEVGDWMWNNRKYYNGITVLPYDGGTYTQPPFEEIDKDTFEKMYSKISEIDVTQIIEIDNNVNHKDIVACGGGSCEIT